MTASNFFGLAPFSEHVTEPTADAADVVDGQRIATRADIPRVIDLLLQHRGVADTPANRAKIIAIADRNNWHDALPADFCKVSDCPAHATATAESMREGRLMRVFR